MLFTQLCLTLCTPIDSGPPGSSVHEISQARILKWVAIIEGRIANFHIFKSQNGLKNPLKDVLQQNERKKIKNEKMWIQQCQKKREVRGVPGRMVKVHPGMAAVSIHDRQLTRSEQRQTHRVLSIPNPSLTRGQNTWESALGSGLDLASLDHTLSDSLLSAPCLAAWIS